MTKNRNILLAQSEDGGKTIKGHTEHTKDTAER